MAQLALEFTLTPIPIISGIVSPGLKGSLDRNGPARLSRNGQQVGNWFDGDDAILAVHFNSSVLGVNNPRLFNIMCKQQNTRLKQKKEDIFLVVMEQTPQETSRSD